MTSQLGMPVLNLEAPFRWASDDEEVMEVGYETFVVRRGCAQDAAVCHPTHAVSVIPRQGWDTGDPVWVQSYALRPPSDPHYLEPGPLPARWSPDVLWTGGEMVVWGGEDAETLAPRVDGAAYDPIANRWWMLAAPPLRHEEQSRAVWAGDVMMVISEEAIVSWDAESGEWSHVAAGIIPPSGPDGVIWTGLEVVVWSGDGLWRLDEDGDDWEPLPTPQVGQVTSSEGVLVMVGGDLHAVGREGCDMLISAWTGAEWSEPDRVVLGMSTGSGCGAVGHHAVVEGELFMWDDTGGDMVAYDPTTGERRRLASPPSMDHGPVVLGERILLPGHMEGALYQPEKDRWSMVTLPGLATENDLVWTGTEVLAWTKCCYGPDQVDAWRWSPPG